MSYRCIVSCNGCVGYRPFERALVAAIRRLGDAPVHVLDIGTGTGLLDFLTTGVQEDKYSLSPAKKDELLRKLALELPERHANLRHLVDEAAEMLSEALESETSTPLQEPLELKKRITSEIQNSPLWEDKVVIPLRKVLAASRDYLEGLYSVVRQLGVLLE